MPTTTAETTCCAVRSTAGAATVAATWTACITASTIGPVVGTATVARASASVISRTIASAAVIAHTAPVVAVAAYWRSGNVSRPESDPNADLGLGVGQRNHQNCQQGHIP